MSAWTTEAMVARWNGSPSSGGRPVEHFGPAVVSVVPAHHELDQGPKLAAQVRFGHPLGHLADFVEIRPLQEADQLGLGPVGAGRRPGSVLREANSHEAKPKHHTPNPGAFGRWAASHGDPLGSAREGWSAGARWGSLVGRVGG